MKSCVCASCCSVLVCLFENVKLARRCYTGFRLVNRIERSLYAMANVSWNIPHKWMLLLLDFYRHLCTRWKSRAFGKFQSFRFPFCLFFKSVTCFRNSICIVNFLFFLFILFTCHGLSGQFVLHWIFTTCKKYKIYTSTLYVLASGKQLYWCQFDLKPLWQCEDLYSRALEMKWCCNR